MGHPRKLDRVNPPGYPGHPVRTDQDVPSRPASSALPGDLGGRNIQHRKPDCPSTNRAGGPKGMPTHGVPHGGSGSWAVAPIPGRGIRSRAAAPPLAGGAHPPMGRWAPRIGGKGSVWLRALGKRSRRLAVHSLFPPSVLPPTGRGSGDHPRTPKLYPDPGRRSRLFLNNSFILTPVYSRSYDKA